MTNAEEQRKIFWELFEEVLIENGEPFKIAYRKGIDNTITSYAAVNKNQSFNNIGIDISFLLRKRKLRVDLYILLGETIPIGQKIWNNKEKINSMVSLPLMWERGEKNKETIRVSVYFDFIQDDIDDYRRVIEESLPTIMEFINVANKYGKDEFFDF